MSDKPSPTNETGGIEPVEAPEPVCWLHPAVEVRPSPIAGRGLFARQRIPAGTLVSRLGGQLVDSAQLTAMLSGPGSHENASGYVDTIAVSDDLHLVLPPGGANRFGNHSCHPDLWWTASYDLSARWDIAAGEELTTDYATSTAFDGFELNCRCGSSYCRGTVRGTDWARTDLQARYADHWVPVLRDRIAASRAT